LAGIHAPAVTRDHGVVFQPGAMEIIDRFARGIEEAAEPNEAVRIMQQRLTAMAIKVAVLSAAGWSEGIPATADVPVSTQDAEMAVACLARWANDARAFAERVGESEFEAKLQRCLSLIREQGAAPRRELARAAHCPKRVMDDIEATLLDRGLITVSERKSSNGHPQIWWGTPAELRIRKETG